MFVLVEAAEHEKVQRSCGICSRMEITLLHHLGTGRCQAAPSCTAVLEQRLMAGEATRKRSLPVGPCSSRFSSHHWSLCHSLLLPEKHLS